MFLIKIFQRRKSKNYLTDKFRTTSAPRAFFSERKSAGSPATSILSNARKSVENYGVFSLSFGPFLSLYLANKEKEKDVKNYLIIRITPYGKTPHPNPLLQGEGMTTTCLFIKIRIKNLLEIPKMEFQQ